MAAIKQCDVIHYQLKDTLGNVITMPIADQTTITSLGYGTPQSSYDAATDTNNHAYWLYNAWVGNADYNDPVFPNGGMNRTIWIDTADNTTRTGSYSVVVEIKTRGHVTMTKTLLANIICGNERIYAKTPITFTKWELQ